MINDEIIDWEDFPKPPEFMVCSGGTKDNPGHSYNFENDGKCDTCEKKLLLVDGKPQGKVFKLSY